MESLSDIYKRHCVTGLDVGHGDKGGTHSYIEWYDRLLSPYRSGCTLMEIGIAQGLSIAMWREYMPTSRIIGVDLSICFDAKPHTDTGTILIASDATKPAFAQAIKDYTFDVVIDDASHMMHDQSATFLNVKSRMNKGGIYIIEDILSLEMAIPHLKLLDKNCQIIDLRHVKKRFDDVLVVFRF